MVLQKLESIVVLMSFRISTKDGLLACSLVQQSVHSKDEREREKDKGWMVNKCMSDRLKMDTPKPK